MSKASTDMGDLFPGDVLIATIIDGWAAFDVVYRKSLGGKPEALGFKRYAAVYEPGIPTQRYMMLVDVNINPTPAPTPAPITEPLRIAVDGGNLYESVNLELQPKE
jgi:hypothetical protein